MSQILDIDAVAKSPDPRAMLLADLADFVTRHRPCGQLTGDAAEPVVLAFCARRGCLTPRSAAGSEHREPRSAGLQSYAGLTLMCDALPSSSARLRTPRTVKILRAGGGIDPDVMLWESCEGWTFGEA